MYTLFSFKVPLFFFFFWGGVIAAEENPNLEECFQADTAFSFCILGCLVLAEIALFTDLKLIFSN